MIITLLRKNWFLILMCTILCAISFCVGWLTHERGSDANESLIRAAYREISGQSIFNQQSDEELAYAAIRGMISTLDDPYAELIEPHAAQNFQNTFSGRTGVVGLYSENKEQQVVVSIVFPGGAAEQAGLRSGDVLLAIDGIALDQNTDSSETGLMLRGVPGSSVQVQIQRDGKILEFDLIRKEQQFVSAKMLPDGIGYISLSAYNATASTQMKLALEELLQQKPAALIWDLRNNEGGDMQAAQDILSYFVDDGLLFSAQLTQNRTVAFRAKGNALAAEIPLVVLMDKTTYSAAETSAAAIAETGRGKTIGSTSYGKGVIQATLPLQANTMLQMTVARWLSPTGKWYHQVGVPPQIEASDDLATEADELLQQAIAIIQTK